MQGLAARDGIVKRPRRASTALICVLRGGGQIEQILRQHQQGDPHQRQGSSLLRLIGGCHHTGHMKMLGPGKSHAIDNIV